MKAKKFIMKTSLHSRRLAGVALLLPLSLLPAMAQRADAQLQANTSGSSTLTIGIEQPFNTMDPAFITNGGTLIDNVFDTLVERNSHAALVPGLATSWKHIAPTVWRFTLRQGVTFTDGEPFNASAVEFTIDRILKAKATSTTYSYISTVSAVKVVGPYTVDIITNAPDPIIPARFSRYPTEIVPPKYIAQHGATYFGSHPVGTGPYKVTSFKADQEVTMVANNDYWRGKPKIQKVVWQVITNAPTMTAALISGSIQLADELPFNSVSQVQSSSTAKVVISKGTGFDFYIGLKTAEPPFNNVKVRQALNYAVNRGLIATDVQDGLAIPTLSLYRTEDFGYAGNPHGYKYNPKLAKRLLAEAGYPKGFTTTLDVTPTYQNAEDVGVTLKQELAKIGVKVNVVNVPSSTYFAWIPVHKEAPMYLLNWGSSQTLDADSAIYPVFACGSPYSTYCNPKMQKLLNAERSSLNQAARKRDFAEIQALAIQQAPRIFLYLQDDVYGLAKDLKWVPNADESVPVFSMTFTR